jgi:hypothetical protein
MPLYSATAPVTALYNGDSMVLAAAESPTSGQFSAVFTLPPNPSQSGPVAFSIEGVFSGAPSTFSYQMQEANSQVTGDFINIGSAISTVNSAQAFRADFTAQCGKFYRLSYATQTTNPVTFSGNAYRP